MWRDAMRGARCLLPAAGWYEWRQPDKQPYYFHRRDGGLAALAGLYSIYKNRLTCAVLSTAAAGKLEAVHERMPVFLDDEAQKAWLEKGEVRMEPADIAFHPVGKAVNKADVDVPELIQPLAA
jgi:putative SOS response-associated peptidase YedK